MGDWDIRRAQLVLLLGVVLVSVGGITGGALAQPVVSSDRTLPNQAPPNGTVAVTVETTVNETLSGPLVLEETFTPAVESASLQAVNVDGTQEFPTAQSATTQGLTIQFDESPIEEGETLTVQYTVTLSPEMSSGDQLQITGDISTAETTSPVVGQETVTVSADAESGIPVGLLGGVVLVVFVAVVVLAYLRSRDAGQGTAQDPFE